MPDAAAPLLTGCCIADEMQPCRHSRSRSPARQLNDSGRGCSPARLHCSLPRALVASEPVPPLLADFISATATLMPPPFSAPPVPLLPPAAPVQPDDVPAAALPPHTEPCWHYNTPRKGIQGAFSLDALATFREHLTRLGRWDTLRLWRTGETEADAVLLASLLP
jgi:hypothetical protein